MAALLAYVGGVDVPGNMVMRTLVIKPGELVDAAKVFNGWRVLESWPLGSGGHYYLLGR